MVPHPGRPQPLEGNTSQWLDTAKACQAGRWPVGYTVYPEHRPQAHDDGRRPDSELFAQDTCSPGLSPSTALPRVPMARHKQWNRRLCPSADGLVFLSGWMDCERHSPPLYFLTMHPGQAAWASWKVKAPRLPLSHSTVLVAANWPLHRAERRQAKGAQRKWLPLHPSPPLRPVTHCSRILIQPPDSPRKRLTGPGLAGWADTCFLSRVPWSSARGQSSKGADAAHPGWAWATQVPGGPGDGSEVGGGGAHLAA